MNTPETFDKQIARPEAPYALAITSLQEALHALEHSLLQILNAELNAVEYTFDTVLGPCQTQPQEVTDPTASNPPESSNSRATEQIQGLAQQVDYLSREAASIRRRLRNICDRSELPLKD